LYATVKQKKKLKACRSVTQEQSNPQMNVHGYRKATAMSCQARGIPNPKGTNVASAKIAN